jgi:PTS system nitrogen regulatory IIA component
MHLQLLGELAQMFSDKAFRDQLQNTDDPVAIHKMFTDWQG